MRKDTVLATLAVVAIIILAIFVNGFILLALVIFFPLLLWRIFKKKDTEDEKLMPKPLTLDEARGQYGEPDDSITIDVTRANESAGNILVYKKNRLLIVQGEPLSMDDILDVSTVNTATPYTIGQYQVVLLTKKADRQYIRFDVGMDVEWANGVATAILDAIKK